MICITAKLLVNFSFCNAFVTNIYKKYALSYHFIMLKKEYRLKKRIAFNATYRTGVSFHKSGITVFCGKKKKEDFPTKIGFVVSKKIHKRAVKRNRIKRLMRESVRLYIKNAQDFDTKYMSLIFVATSRLLGMEFSEVDKIIKKLMDIIENA